jgi:hypothetical protein
MQVAALPHPPHGSVSGPHCGFSSPYIFYKHESLSDPGSVYRAILIRDPFTGSIEISFDQHESVCIGGGVDKGKFETVRRQCTM